MAKVAPKHGSYKDYLPNRPGFPLPFADRPAGYAVRREEDSRTDDLARRIAAAGGVVGR